MNYKLTLLVFLLTYSVFAQEYHPKNDGVKTPKSSSVAFTNATIYVNPSTILKQASLLIKDDKVVAVGKNISIPKNTQTINLEGKFIYPSFIDVYSNFGMKAIEKKHNQNRPQYDSNRKGYYWNDHIRPETNALDYFNYDNKKATELLKAGFGIVNTHQLDGIASGTGLLVALNKNGNISNQVLDNQSAQYFSFKKSKLSNQKYPTSLMGSIALLRQVAYDADYYQQGHIKTTDLSLEAYNNHKNLPAIFNAGSWLNDLRVNNLSKDTKIKYTILGGGDEYQHIDKIKATNTTYILPVNFPKAYDVSDPFQASKVSLEDMKHWNLAPSNPKLFAKNNIPFALTTHKLKSATDFNKMLQKAITNGLTETEALTALTTTPAAILKNNKIGNLQKGSYANFMISSGNIFDSENILYEHWVMGKPNVFENKSKIDIRGNYKLTLKGKEYNISIKGKIARPTLEVTQDTIKLTSKLSYKNNWLNIHFKDHEKTTYNRLVAKITNPKSTINGKITLSNGTDEQFIANYFPLEKNKKDNSEKQKSTPELVAISYPNMPYGFKQKPKKEDILFKNVTVWTNESEGVLKNTDVLIKDGKIVKIGTNLKNNGAKIIDGTGKHLTAGIVDEHSHIATSAVNESGHNSTAEVSIGDVVNSNDINIYRNLAGGVTTIQILHGSANPIGGQSALIKLKWGATPDEMLIPNAPKFIKFALGENVKQSNWGDYERVRFPQTRMGVEQVYIDYFTRAKEYEAKKKSGQPYRKDVELETLLEIINKERFISCHSYQQAEITMLMRVAEQFNFNINTFTHILEGYKVADKMKKHGVGGSTFSDWWAYKYEVNDAIPHNGAIMHNAGITVAFNSDDAEMSRRLNQEAAKAVKYGNVPEEEAWKFVTLNPAKLLHLDKNIGSIKVGKDADIVLWNNHPMSVYAKAEKTMIEGVVYFDLQKDLELRKTIKEERNKLINMMINDKNNGGKTQSPKKKEKKHIHCDFEGDLH
ncbi:amidohydrolase family protein [Pseudofulvibacter geojedonensis]|uniref:Amidohydrolase family protein n=1 Tax=Pseudofulvibacter geojedonensis TaxID=1123758 RepID=A0ABW3I1Z9_9FLAO